MLSSLYEPGPVLPGDVYQRTNYPRLPVTQNGNYYLILKTDADNTLVESSEGNNTLAVPVSIVFPGQGQVNATGGVGGPVTTEAPQWAYSRRGRIPGRFHRPELATVPLCLRGNASPFWIILLLVWANLEPLTLNQRVQGSSPCAPTNRINWLLAKSPKHRRPNKPRGSVGGNNAC